MKNQPTDDTFDMIRPPIRQRWYLRPLTWLMSFPETRARHLRVTRTNTDGLKPPYLLLCTHMSFVDFKVTTTAIFPHRANYVVAIDGFIGREWLLRNVGGVLKRKFTNDLTMVRQIKRVIDNGDILALYPEARYSLIGTTAVLPDSLGKLVRLLGVPVAVLNMHGDYLYSPVWNLRKRKINLAADLTLIMTSGETRSLPVGEINRRIREAFVYDEYRWQKENSIRIAEDFNAEGLHKVLYQCPACKTEHQMDSQKTRIWCRACGKAWDLLPEGSLAAVDGGRTEFPHPPDWYEFERAEVRRQIENGVYEIMDEVDVDLLPNSKGYVHIGRGRLVHNLDGFLLEGDFTTGPLALRKPPASLYSCHIEYNYDQRGDCVSLSTLSDTYYIYPKNLRNCVTKIALATEELYDFHRKKGSAREEES